MTNDKLIELLQEDLKNERMHCLFYQQAAAIVRGPHREELRELFLKEAHSELEHVDEFSTLIVQLGGIPGNEVGDLPAQAFDWTTPEYLCRKAFNIESTVADNYKNRLMKTDSSNFDDHEVTTELVYVNLFYEDQLKDSKKAALEFRLLT